MTFGSCHVVSFVPGRIRVFLPKLKKNKPLCQEFENAFSGIPGISRVKANPLTGRALIIFEPKVKDHVKNLPYIDLTPLKSEEAAVAPKDFLTLFENRREEKDKEMPCVWEDLSEMPPDGWGNGARGGSDHGLLSSVAGQAFTAVFTGVAFIYSLFARLFFGPSEDMGPLSLPFAIQSGTSLVLGYPPLRSAVEKAPAIGFVTGPLSATFTAILVSAWRKNSLGLLLGLILGLSSFAHTDLSQKSVQEAKRRSDQKRAVKGLPTCTPETVAKASMPDEESREWLHIPSDLPDLENYARKMTGIAFSGAIFLFLFTGNWIGSLAILLVANPRTAYTSATVSMAAALDVLTDRGVLVRKNHALSRIARIDEVWIECQGVLTRGTPRVLEIVAFDRALDEREIASYAWTLLKGTQSPIESALAEWAMANGVTPKDNCIRGSLRPHGILGEVDGFMVGFGTQAFLRAKGVSTRKAQVRVRRLTLMGCEVFGLSIKGTLVGLIGVRDDISDQAAVSMERVRALGFPDVRVIEGECSDWVMDDLALSPGSGPQKGSKSILVGRSDDMLSHSENSYLTLATEDATCDLMDEADLISTGSWAKDLPWLLDLGQRLKEITRQNVLISSTAGLFGMILALTGRLPLYLAPSINEIVNLLVAFNAQRLLASDARAKDPGGGNDGAPGEDNNDRPNGGTDPRNLESIMPKDLAKGLTFREASLRLQQFGTNQLTMEPPPGWFDLFRSQFANVPTRVLFLVASVSGLTGHFVDSAAIGVILLINAALGASQECRSEKTLLAMQDFLAPKARVLREGTEIEIDAAEVVPGDILMLQTGDRIPADALVLDSQGLMVEESSLTGESAPISKRSSSLRLMQPETAVSLVKSLPVTQDALENLPRAEDSEVVFMGTSAVKGKARAMVISTGMSTQMGQIVILMQSGGAKSSPLQSKYEGATKTLVYVSLIAGGLVTVLGVLAGRGSPIQMALTGLSVAVAAIPEGLPTVVNIALASGVQRVAKRGALVRRLSAMDTLGRVTIICSDKTGTITANEMSIATLSLPGRSFAMDDIERIKSNEDAIWALTIGIVCNEAKRKGDHWDFRQGRDFLGDAVDLAFVEAGTRAHLEKEDLDHKYREIYLLPFESDRAYMSILCSGQDGKTYLFIKGAPEIVIGMCSKYRLNGNEMPMGDDTRQRMEKEAFLMGKRGYKVIATAYKTDTPEGLSFSGSLFEDGLVFSGLFGMTDPPRPDVNWVVQKCRREGVRVAMVTGDHPETARTVARIAGILDDDGLVLSGHELDTLDDSELDSVVSQVQVFARVKPSHKLRIVNSLKRLGHVVVMTGDGVNDAPAIKWADVGFAMGTGTEVTKDASSVVLTDNCFATISNAVDEGKVIRRNIHSAMEYLVTGNLGEVLLMALTILAGLPIPLLPLQILLVNLFTDALPALALALREPTRKELGNVQDQTEDSRFFGRIARRGIMIGLSSAVSFWLALKSGGGLQKASSVAFASIVGNQFLQMYHWPSLGLAKGDCFREKTVRKMLGISWLSFLSSLYIPPLAGLFGFQPLNSRDWLLALAPSAIGTVAISVFEGTSDKGNNLEQSNARFR